MKIRTQFILLLIALFLVPVFMLGSMVLSSWFRSPSHIFIPSWESISQQEGVDSNKEEWNQITDFIAQLPQSVDAAVLSAQGEVLLSSIPGIEVGTSLTETELMKVFAANTDDYIYQIDRQFQTGEGNSITSNLMLITRLLREDQYQWNVVVDQLRAIVNVFSILLFLCISGIIYLSHVLSRSMEVLEKETRNLAKGNLNKEIQVRGNNEILSLTNSLNSMRLALLEEQKRRSWLIMGISHDLRTPLSLIKGYTEAIFDGTADSPEMIEKSLEIVGEKVNQLDSMIDDLINFVRMDSGEWRQNMESISITPLLTDYAARLTEDGKILGRSITTAIELPADLQISLDESLMIRVLDNLCSNAIHYTPAGGTISLTATLAPSHKKKRGNQRGGKNTTKMDILILKVQDSGCGISKEDQPHVFDPFFRGDNSLKSQGKGLGLAVVKTVADGLGWNIQLESEKGRGSCFTLEIPV
ncbi:MAG: HAMP domain-containing histidine kinase [Spirochaetaceae bacterium]|nr:HAMP domain-containing histidine kinase [Spirochaetaceae bacterium]